jgi:hypothetical protein
VGYGRIYGRKGLEDQFLFAGVGWNHIFHLGPLVGTTPDGNRVIGLFGDATESREGGHVTGTVGGGFYLVVEPASECVK